MINQSGKGLLHSILNMPILFLKWDTS